MANQKRIRMLREKLRKVYKEISDEFHGVMTDMDNALALLEGENAKD